MAEKQKQKYQSVQRKSWVQNQNLYSVESADPQNVMTYWRYVLKRELKAKKYHEDLNKRVHEPYYNQNMREAHMHKTQFNTAQVAENNNTVLQKNNTHSELKSRGGIASSVRSKSIVTEVVPSSYQEGLSSTTKGSSVPPQSYYVTHNKSSRLQTAQSVTQQQQPLSNILVRRSQFRKDFAELLCSQTNQKAGHLIDLVALKKKHQAPDHLKDHEKEVIIHRSVSDYQKIDNGLRNNLQSFLKSKASHNFAHVSNNEQRRRLASIVFKETQTTMKQELPRVQERQSNLFSPQLVPNKSGDFSTHSPFGMKKKSSTAIDLLIGNKVTTPETTAHHYNRSSSNQSYTIRELQRQIAVNQNIRALAEAEVSRKIAIDNFVDDSVESDASLSNRQKLIKATPFSHFRQMSQLVDLHPYPRTYKQ